MNIFSFNCRYLDVERLDPRGSHLDGEAQVLREDVRGAGEVQTQHLEKYKKFSKLNGFCPGFNTFTKGHGNSKHR